MERYYIDEQFGKVPIGWEIKRLKDVCTNSGGYGANATALPYFEDCIRYIRITDIDDYGNLIKEDKASITETLARQYMLQDDDMLFARTGDTVGKSLLYKETMGKAAYAGYLIKFTFNKSIIVPEYFNAIAKSDFFESFKIAMKRIGAKPNINSREYSSFKFPLPIDIKEQTAIATILSRVDAAIESVQRSIAAAERLKKSLMQNLLTGKMKPDGTFRTAEEFYVDEKFGKIPVGWEVKKLGELFAIKAGGDVKPENYSSSKDIVHKYPIYANSLDKNGLYGYTSNPRVHAKESLTITGRGVGVGHPEYRQGDYDSIIRLISLIPLKINTIDCKYTCYYIDQFVKFPIESTGVPQLTCPKVFSTKIVCPSCILEQEQIAIKISTTNTEIQSKQQKIATLERLKKSLMQNLLTGRVRVDVEKVKEIIKTKES